MIGYNTQENGFGISICSSEITSFPLHSHKSVEVTCVLEGSVEAEINLNKVTLEENDIFVSFPNDFHSYNPLLKNTRTCKIVIDPSEFGMLVDTFQNYRPISHVIKSETAREHFPDFINGINDVTVRLHSDNPRDILSAYSDIAVFLTSLLELLGLKNEKKKINNEFFVIAKYCSENYNQINFSLKQLSESLSISANKIQKLFKEHVNVKFKDYVTLLRMDEARRLLSETDLSVTTVAFNVGFSSVSAFSRTFKCSFGVSASDYRRIYRNGGSI